MVPELDFDGDVFVVCWVGECCVEVWCVDVFGFWPGWAGEGGVVDDDFDVEAGVAAAFNVFLSVDLDVVFVEGADFEDADGDVDFRE